MDQPISLAVLLSGGGTTLQNLLDRIADGRLDARIAAVVSSRADALGLLRAQNAGLPTTVVERRACRDRTDFSCRIFEFCRLHKADLVCMAGFLQLLEIPADFTNRVMNIHPALIPSFCGKGFHGMAVHRAVLEAGVKISGCTVHFADNEYDHGPIISQRAVAVLDDDTLESLAARVFAQECEAYPEAIAWFAAGRLEIHGRRVRLR
jgi:formyltetrahydrofolate-dependent phosphoribosylglycinamide formyltransferase